jgi:hypothetical protein
MIRQPLLSILAAPIVLGALAEEMPENVPETKPENMIGNFLFLELFQTAVGSI